MSAPPSTIRHHFNTLRRGQAGVREDHRSVIASLGLRKREQTVRRRNDAALRGAVDKVKIGRGADFGDREMGWQSYGHGLSARLCSGGGECEEEEDVGVSAGGFFFFFLSRNHAAWTQPAGG